MSDLGTRLREARESRGLTLQQVEEQLRIRRQFLAALEEERYDALPGDVYTRGFLQNYARFLGLPVEEIVEQYSGTQDIPHSLTQIPTVLDEPLLGAARRPAWPGVFVGLMLALVILVGGYYVYARFVLNEDPLVALRSSPLIANLRENGGTPNPAAPTQAGDRTPARTPTGALPGAATGAATLGSPTAQPTPTATLANAVITPTPRRSMTPTATPTATVEQPTAVQPVESGTPPPAGAVTVVARVIETAWVSVTIDGEQVLAETLEPGAEFTWVGQQTVDLRIGNAAGLELTVNGVAMGSLGASGEVVDVTYAPTTAP